MRKRKLSEVAPNFMSYEGYDYDNTRPSDVDNYEGSYAQKLNNKEKKGLAPKGSRTRLVQVKIPQGYSPIKANIYLDLVDDYNFTSKEIRPGKEEYNFEVFYKDSDLDSSFKFTDPQGLSTITKIMDSLEEFFMTGDIDEFLESHIVGETTLSSL